MPTQTEHEQRAIDNAAFQGRIRTDSLEWQVTALFYGALHAVDSHLAKSNVHPPRHYERDQAIDNNPDFRQIRRAYKKLKGLSVRARYEPNLPIGPSEVTSAMMLLNNIQTHIGALP